MQAALRWLVVWGGVSALLGGCGGGMREAPPTDARLGVDASANPPRLGAHGLTFHRHVETNMAPISTPPLNTQESGSTIVVAVGRGDKRQFSLPTDNKGNTPYVQLGTAHQYTLWTSSGTALYAFTSATGGGGHIVSAATPPSDEITLAAVEIMNGRTIQDFAWNEVLRDKPTRSPSVTTTGPATLVAVWWGDGGADDIKIATPDNGFAVIDSIGQSGSLVQCYVAVRQVSEAGTYDVTWTSTPVQGAQLWLVAVQ